MPDLRLFASTSNIVRFILKDKTTGQNKTGLSTATSGLIISTITDNEATATSYTAAGSTIETITTLGTFATPTATKCRFKEVDSTNHKGLYEFQFANARFAVTSAKRLVISVNDGESTILDVDYEIELTQFDPFDSVRLGLTALPNAAANANAGLPILSVSGTTLGYTVSTLTTYTGNTVQTGDAYAVVADTQFGNAKLIRSTTPANTLTVDSAHKVAVTLAAADVSGNLTVDLQTIKTQTVTCAAGVTVGAFVGNATAALGVDASGRIDLGKWIGTTPLAMSSQQVQAIVPDTQKVDLNTIKTQTVTCAGGVTVPAATLASTTNITAGTVTTATNVTTVNGLAAGVITTAAFAAGATLPRVTLVDTLTTYTGNTVQTGDSFALIGAAGAGLTALGDTRIAHLDADVTSRLAPTVAARTLDVSAGGEAGIDWANVGSPTTTLALTGTTIATTQHVITDSGTVTTVTNQLTAAQVATGVWQDATAGDFTTASSIGKSLYTSGAVPGAANGLFIAGTNAATTITTGLTTTFTGNLTGSVASVSGAVGSVTGSVGSVGTGGITTASFATGAINAAAIASDADAEIAAGVWDLAVSGHTASGTFGAAVNAAGSVGDPWSTSLPGSYGLGTAGFFVGTYLDVAVSSRTKPADTQAAVTVVGSVTGAVGSVTGNVGGSVASVAAGVTVTTNNDKTGYSLTVAPPTAAAIATAIFTDTTASDFTTAGSPGKILVAQLGGAFTTTSSSVLTTAALANAPGISGDVTVGSLTAAALAQLFTTDTTKVYADAVSGSVVKEIGSNAGGGSVTVGGYAAGQDPATLVLDVAASLHNVANSVGAKINTTANVLNQLSGASITLISPVVAGGDTYVAAGDDYYAADGRALSYVNVVGTWADLTGATVTLVTSPDGGHAGQTLSMTVVTPTGPNQTVRIEPTAAQTTASLVGQTLIRFPLPSTGVDVNGYRYPFRIVAVLADGHKTTLVVANWHAY